MSTVESGLIRAAAVEAEARDYWRLLKPRVMALVMFTAVVGLLAAPTAPHPVIAIASLLCVAIGAGASGALNMWWDADIDARMARTAKRPVPSGRVTAGEAAIFGLVLSVLSVGLLSLFANALSAALLAATIAFYVVVYTMWLKRSTSQNIVIGGAAGAAPPVIGWAIATGEVGLEPLILFAIIFFWTPPHTWALAIFRRSDYAAVRVPMLPVAAGDREARRQIVAYSVVLAAVSLAPVATPLGGPVYGVVAAIASAVLLRRAVQLARRDEASAEADGFRAEKKFFGYSILYLFVLFAALGAEAVARMGGFYVW